MKQVWILTLTLSSTVFAQNQFSALEKIKTQAPYAKILLRSYPLTLAELDALEGSSITVKSHIELSLLFNTLDLEDAQNPVNEKVKKIFEKKNLRGIAVLINKYFDPAIQFQGVDENLKELILDDKVDSVKFKHIVRKVYLGLFTELQKMIEIDLKPEVQNPGNGFSMLSYVMPGLNDVNALNETLSFAGPKLSTLYNEAVVLRVIRKLKNKDAVLPFKEMAKGKINEGFISGTYHMSTTCGSETQQIDKAVEFKAGRIYNCDPGNYSRNAHAKFSPAFETSKSFDRGGFPPLPNNLSDPERVHMNFAYETSVTGGYSCENKFGMRDNCKNHTSSVKGKINGRVELAPCTDIYSCNLHYSFDFFANGPGKNKFTLLRDGKKIKRLTSVIRDEKHVFGFTLSDQVSHSGGSGKKGELNQLGMTLSAFRAMSFMIPVPDQIHAESLRLRAMANWIKQKPDAINDIGDILRKLKTVAKNSTYESLVETASLYSVIDYILTYKSKFSDPNQVKALNILHRNASNRLRDMRVGVVERTLRDKVTRYQNRFGENSLYLSVLENLMKYENQTQDLLEEYELIITSLLKGQNVTQDLEYESKHAILKGLYVAEVMEKEELVTDIVNLLAELAHYQDLTQEQLDLLDKIKAGQA